jgi:hypothetical protein
MFLTENKKMQKFLILALLFLIFTILFSGCTNTIHKDPRPSENTNKPDVPPPPLGDTWKLPISIPEGNFYKIAGWLSDEQVLYITNHEQTSSIYCYQLTTGESKLLYKSEEPIVNVEISPKYQFILIHSSPSSYEGIITVIDSNGLEVARQSVPSYELVFEWNPYRDSEILITSFFEDWTFQMQLLDIKNNKTSYISSKQPFIKWFGEDKVVYINWDDESPSLLAPLVSKKLGYEEEEILSPEVFQFSTFKDVLMTIGVNEQDILQSSYSFYTKGMESLFSFSMPQLSMYSGWFVPSYDYNLRNGEFITFKPLRSGEADSYSEDFQLVSYNINKGTNTLILDGMKHAPIKFSPSGKALLYGDQFEKIIDINGKSIYEVINK